MEDQPIQTSAQQPAKQKPWYKRTGPSLAVAGAVLVVLAGFVHVVHGGATTICWKDGWSLSDTFVDPDDYVGRSRIEMIDKMKVIRALEKCGVLEFESRGE